MRFVHLALACLAAMHLANAALAEDLAIPGSGNPEYVLGHLASAFNQQQSAHRVSVPPSTGTAGALRDVEAGTASLGRVGRPLKEEERRKGLSYVMLGRDPVVFAAGAKVSVRSITQAQIVDLYSGKIADWRALGGKPDPVRAIGREATDASHQAISRFIKPFQNIAYGEDVKVVHLDPQMIELLDRFPTSLGFLNQSALYACKTKVVRLALDGVEPVPENLENGRYALWLELGLIYKAGGLKPAGEAFLKFVKSPAGARILREHGVLPAVSAR
jgi:phosphate transport system substrate-binding protein